MRVAKHKPANASSTIAGKQANKIQAEWYRRQDRNPTHISRQQPPLRQHTSVRIFSYTENKTSGLQPLYSRRLRRRPLPYISHLTGISITPPAALFPKALPASHQPRLPSSAFCNPRTHPHRSALPQYQAPRR